MKRYIAVCLTLLPLAHVAAQPGLVLRYDRPAEVWTEAIPIGNGRLGAMVFGGAENEQLQLNEATLWSGGPVKKNINPDAFRYLAPSRAALTRGDFAQAKELLKNMQGAYTESYLPLADVLIKQQLPQHEVADYERTLNLSDAIATTQFSVNGTHYRREVFASAPANIIVMHFNADRKRQLSLQIGARSSLHFATLYSDGRLILQGKAPAHVDPSYFNVNAEPIVYDDPSHCKGMRFEMIVKPIVTDGVISYSDGYIAIKDASEVVLLISAATSFNGFDHCPDSQGKNQHEISASYINKASRHSVEQLRNAHVLDYRRYFDRVNLMLNPDEDDHSSLTTTQRLDNYTRGATDSALEALYFQYGRY
ncbi:MAG TPA: glycoside hydrolase family 95 protein, partial [Steroidobacteraceae bacterium]|nr:glycoside hydrolase family 95 protein [Steroidobacteraceae bacterium]